MSIFGWFTSKPKTVDDIFDKDNGLLTQVGGWIGNQQFTDQERATYDQDTIKGIQKFVVDTLAENTDRSKARREIAVFFIKFYSIMLFMCGMTYPIDPEWSLMWFKLATSLSVGGLITAISVFFFGSHAINRYQDAKK
jgi:hypothetical protein